MITCITLSHTWLLLFCQLVRVDKKINPKSVWIGSRSNECIWQFSSEFAVLSHRWAPFNCVTLSGDWDICQTSHTNSCSISTQSHSLVNVFRLHSLNYVKLLLPSGYPITLHLCKEKRHINTTTNSHWHLPYLRIFNVILLAERVDRRLSLAIKIGSFHSECANLN